MLAKYLYIKGHKRPDFKSRIQYLYNTLDPLLWGYLDEHWKYKETMLNTDPTDGYNYIVRSEKWGIVESENWGNQIKELSY